MRVRFLGAASQEFLAEVRYYNAEQAGLGLRFSVAVEEALARALAFPLSGSRGPARTRRMFLRGFPFAVVYRQRKRRDALTPLRRMRQQRSCGEVFGAHAALVPADPSISGRTHQFLT